MDYKDTLLLPKTKFPMRGNLPQKEPKRYKRWEELNIYSRMKQNREERELFTLHDGPPYANGDIHIGHALNKILKDIILKHNYFQGRAVRFVPGWDCHGLPIEQKVEEKIGKSKKETMPISEFRELCRRHAKKYIDIQRESFKRLGVVADWDNPYITMDFKFEANIYRTLCEVAKRGLLVERHKPIFWSWSAKTALADAEVEYKDKEDYSIYINFELNNSAKRELNIEGRAGIVIWTTTPWTLPANVAISLNPKEIYILTKDGYIVAKARYNNLIEEGLFNGEIEKEFSPKELENLITINPLNGRESKIILGEHVLMDGGTGCVHTAPGHGEDDYRVGLKYNLDVIMPVDESGCYNELVVGLNLLPNPEEFVGVHIFKANKKILELLGDNLLKVTKFTHSYPHCWRTKKPLIYRATNQWFIAVDKPLKDSDKSLREIALDAINGVLFIPTNTKNRLKPMIENRPDWCISRQRSWGVPIAFFRKKRTKELILDSDILDNIASIFDKKGADAWYNMSIAELLPENSKYNPDELEKISDILDVWFDSGSTWNSVLKSGNYDAGEFPASLYLEGSDQHRGWFQSSLLLSSAIEGNAPYKALITHGFTVDERGEKMSKSKGNVVAPDKVIKQYGSEILRLWVAVSDYQNDLKISNNILKQTAEQYRKIRNTFRFLLANIDDLEEPIDIEEFGELDKWILNRAKGVFDEVRTLFNKSDFLKGLGVLNNFITNELSGIYLDITKDRLYCDIKDSTSRRATQSAMVLITKSMLGLTAPILTYTADEIIEYAPKALKGDMESIFDLEYQELPETKSFNDRLLLEAREKFLEIIDRLKKDKRIKSTLEVEIIGDISIFPLKNKDLEDWFIISALSANSNRESLGEFSIEDKIFKIVKASKYKCPRCWRFKSETKDKLCNRCKEVVN